MRNSVYTVYDNRTDEPVVVDGTAEACAEAMGIKLNSFFQLISRLRKGTKERWAIIKTGEEELAPPKTLGEWIRYHRLRRGMKLYELAEAAGINSATLGNYENDRHEPTLFAATCIADVLGVSLDYLAGRKKYGA